MILNGFQHKRILIGYQFHFGLVSHDDIAFSKFCERCPFSGLALGCYRTASDSISLCKYKNPGKVLDPDVQPQLTYIPAYQKNVRRRIRPFYRLLRDSIVIEFRPLPVTSLLLSDKIISSSGQPFTLGILLVLQKIGSGSVTIWLDNWLPKNEQQWYGVRDPCLLTIKLETPELKRKTWPLISFVRYLVALSHTGLSSKNLRLSNIEASDCLESDSGLDGFLEKNVSGLFREGTYSFVEINNYPLFFIQFDNTTEELRKQVLSNPADIRLILCGDRNWRCKSEKIVDESVLKADTSSRDSIFWLVNSEGTVKLTSSELETSVEESFTATLLETDIILTMRYFLQRMNNLMLRLTTSKLAPTDLPRLRHRLFTDLDKYCNIEVSHKDTTLRRIRRFKKLFQIDELYQGVVARFDLLGSKLSSQHTASLEIQHTLLTLVFGFFGALSVLYSILNDTSILPSSGVFSPKWLSLSGAIVTTIILLFVIRLVRRIYMQRR